MQQELQALLAPGGAISRRDHPQLENAIRHALAAGTIVPLLWGTYAGAATFRSVAEAVQLWDPHSVLTGATAAHLSWWPELRADKVEALSRRRSRRDVSLLNLTQGDSFPELVHKPGELRLAHPAWSVLELTDTLGGKPIDEALRRRATSLKAMWWALGLMPGRRGNVKRRRLLVESRAEPWSALERDAHVLLHAAGITGWTTNHKLILPTGEVRLLDICFPEYRFGVELDGERYHSSSEAFHADRYKDMWAARLGWRIVRLTTTTLAELVPTIQACIPELGQRSA
ncbi:hypothetical protein LKO27_11820 [Tessaracoccus sp. OS52]|uniref:hypothetical protein n=1 Tax=Tessaracoccus sp. OS52 TaxID=2886691 RepID=UPI001D11F68A|nr:hypothetical protein [Tessaracoccus sp. OS52]MCC2594094.1 hypothetical protein [Tessaracoccus sp. OS52]